MKKIFTNRGAGSSFDKGTDQARRNAKFSTNYVFNCIRLYLAFLLGISILRECYTCVIDLRRYKIIPFKTRFELMIMELTKTSKMFMSGVVNCNMCLPGGLASKWGYSYYRQRGPPSLKIEHNYLNI